ncbi:UDP-N-acetylglucosamine 4,6-dehydratase [Algoriphagus sp. CAU 1675]|uniref:UDP-N-acetylglucosamine 4,6-dehydratase n=1 Tax=Algoriphagus sp. CAU 1675 TaxID=3032597 RepID=UPI0023DAEE2E|nr:UDP-N-acetylglucosamine 4,6-dehydratase [Algoriphagus sp. CAU 1675]MDF2158195.1 UDP-N-acetylglucosamine 4,6-dehydratase [Algoriphagus sp. CAU 1675]
MDILKLIGRKKILIAQDIEQNKIILNKKAEDSKFLVIGGAGSIGQAVTKEIFKRNPKKLHVVDISENNLVEMVRDIRSSFGYIAGDFRTFALDIGSPIYDAFWESDGDYDYVLNLSALKHVRSEKDPFTLMRMVEVNILNTLKTIQQSKEKGVKKYFCVSTDKAANPVNMMGASKRIMELFLMRESRDISISTARFANVAFSDGSLLHGFNQRLHKKQPIVAPNDIKRYFVTPQESGELCLMSCLLGENNDIFFPKLSEDLHLITFAEIAVNYLKQLGYEPYICSSEEEARQFFNLEYQSLFTDKKYWPCYFTKSDTTGEKDFEEFFMEGEILDLERFENLGIVKSSLPYKEEKLDWFLAAINGLLKRKQWVKKDIVNIFYELLPAFDHKETGKNLDSKM